MTDWLSVMERGLKAVRCGIFQASDNLAMLLDGFCRAPEDSAAGSPPNAADDPAGGDLAPTPEAGATSLPGHPNPANDGLRAISDMCGVPYSVIADCLREIADDLDPK